MSDSIPPEEAMRIAGRYRSYRPEGEERTTESVQRMFADLRALPLKARRQLASWLVPEDKGMTERYGEMMDRFRERETVDEMDRRLCRCPDSKTTAWECPIHGA
jgi:hypothetical protein